MSLNPDPFEPVRLEFHAGKLFTEQLSSGQNYLQIKKVISIIITDYGLKQLSGSGRYHHQFRYRTGDGLELTDLAEINTLELSRLPLETDNTDLWNWMRFMETKDEEELKMLATKSPELKKAVGVLMELSEDERTRMIAENREIAHYDEISRLNGAIRERNLEIARNALAEGASYDFVSKITGLDIETIKRLKV